MTGTQASQARQGRKGRVTQGASFWSLSSTLSKGTPPALAHPPCPASS